MTDNPLSPHGAVPQYTPPHLRGKVWDFRNEPDGKISFQHPEASLGLAPSQSRVTMTPEEYKLSFDPAHRMTRLDEAASTGYAPMHRRPETESRKLNNMIGKGVNSALGWGTSSQGKAVGTAGLLAALAGGVGGYMWGRDRDESPIRRALLMALLAGGVGAAGTAWAQNKHNRREAYLSKNAASMDITQAIISMLNRDPSLNSGQRALIFRALINTGPSEREDLYRLLSTVAGGGVGILALRFLGAKGLLPMLAGGILGGAIGNSFGSSPRRNALGQTSLDYI